MAVCTVLVVICSWRTLADESASIAGIVDFLQFPSTVRSRVVTSSQLRICVMRIPGLNGPRFRIPGLACLYSQLELELEQPSRASSGPLGGD
jgi:hypothetical protein